MKRLILVGAAMMMMATGSLAPTAHAGQSKRVECVGVLVEVDMVERADFPMAVVYDNSNFLAAHTCVFDVGRAGHWPLRGPCAPGEQCRLIGPYFKKIGDTYYMRAWDKAEIPGEK